MVLLVLYLAVSYKHITKTSRKQRRNGYKIIKIEKGNIGIREKDVMRGDALWGKENTYVFKFPVIGDNNITYFELEHDVPGIKLPIDVVIEISETGINYREVREKVLKAGFKSIEEWYRSLVISAFKDNPNISKALEAFQSDGDTKKLRKAMVDCLIMPEGLECFKKTWIVFFSDPQLKR
ncbi:MAG: hypothetical protein PHW01_03035 [Patescibacteria group bacterium]|nr:hypothetical protein [Patescibacteria group bacterium]